MYLASINKEELELNKNISVCLRLDVPVWCPTRMRNKTWWFFLRVDLKRFYLEGKAHLVQYSILI